VKRRAARDHDQETAREQSERHRDALLAELRDREAARRGLPPADAAGDAAGDAAEDAALTEAPEPPEASPSASD
jgi:hypothetical protein